MQWPGKKTHLKTEKCYPASLHHLMSCYSISGNYFATTPICRVAIATASSSQSPPTPPSDTRPRCDLVIGWASLLCHQGNWMMWILPHERKRNHWVRPGAAGRLPSTHWWRAHGSQTVVGPFTHPSEEEEGPGRRFFPPPLSSSSSVRKPGGDQLVTRRPWVSTREYGGWVCPGERRGDGDVPDMVKDRQRDPLSSLMKCGNTWPSGRCPKAASSLKNCACSWL